MPACFRRKQGEEKEKKWQTLKKLKTYLSPEKSGKEKKKRIAFDKIRQFDCKKNSEKENIIFYIAVVEHPNKEIKKATVSNYFVFKGHFQNKIH